MPAGGGGFRLGPGGMLVSGCRFNRAGLIAPRVASLPRRPLEEGVAAGLRQQRFDLNQDFPVIPTGLLEKGGPLTRIPAQSRVIGRFHTRPSVGIHTLEILAPAAPGRQPVANPAGAPAISAAGRQRPSGPLSATRPWPASSPA